MRRELRVVFPSTNYIPDTARDGDSELMDEGSRFIESLLSGDEVSIHFGLYGSMEISSSTKVAGREHVGILISSDCGGDGMRTQRAAAYLAVGQRVEREGGNVLEALGRLSRGLTELTQTGAS